MEVIYGTVGILIATNILGAIYSYMVLYTDIFKNLRIQERAYKPDIFFKRLPLIALNLVLLALLSGAGLYFLKDQFILEMPPLWLILVQVPIYFLIDDLWFYGAHRLMHENKWMMKKIHSIHHRAVTPFPMEYIYVHPLEWMMGSVGTFIGLFVFLAIGGGEAFIIPFWIFAALRNLHEIEIHSDVKSIIGDKIPLLAPTEHHDTHHARSKGNYASTFRIWDRVFNTEIKLKQKAKVKTEARKADPKAKMNIQPVSASLVEKV